MRSNILLSRFASSHCVDYRHILFLSTRTSTVKTFSLCPSRQPIMKHFLHFPLYTSFMPRWALEITRQYIDFPTAAKTSRTVCCNRCLSYGFIEDPEWYRSSESFPIAASRRCLRHFFLCFCVKSLLFAFFTSNFFLRFVPQTFANNTLVCNCIYMISTTTTIEKTR